MSYRDKEDGEIFWEVRYIAQNGTREDGKDAATVNRRNAACCCERFIEEGLILGGYLLGVKFVAEDRWFVGDPVAIDQQC